ncbi:MAG: hypothetical protein KBB39_17585 [Phycicoccus sp.]|nr:hypothetical protein [Phycicoccus sp.]
MRIRSTRPEFWRSERIAAVSWDARLVLKGLESYVDDNGVGKDDIALIVGDLFQRDLIRESVAKPREGSRTVARVSEAISELQNGGLLWRYAVEGDDLLFVAFWESVQRIDKAQPGRFPRPDGTWNYKDSQIRESVANVREASRSLAPVTGEQGNRGTGEETSSATASRFAEFWTAYPKKVSKGQAEKAWTRAAKTTDPQLLIAAAVAYGASRKGEDQKFTKHPATWLNSRCWEDGQTVTSKAGEPEVVSDGRGRQMEKFW